MPRRSKVGRPISIYFLIEKHFAQIDALRLLTRPNCCKQLVNQLTSSASYLILTVYVNLAAVENFTQEHLVASQGRQMQLDVRQCFFLRGRDTERLQMQLHNRQNPFGLIIRRKISFHLIFVVAFCSFLLFTFRNWVCNVPVG